VTVSSTAALESLALNLPTALVDDFGISEELLNEPFAGSGCLVALADAGKLFRESGPVPDAAWLDENYLHSSDSELPDVVSALAAQRADGTLRELPDVRPWLWPRHLRVLLQSVLPAPVYQAILVVGRPVKRVLGGAAPSLENR